MVGIVLLKYSVSDSLGEGPFGESEAKLGVWGSPIKRFTLLDQSWCILEKIHLKYLHI